MINLSAGVSKSVAVTERLRLKTEGTFTNVFNHTNLGDPSMNLSSSSFGSITSSSGIDQGGNRTVKSRCA